VRAEVFEENRQRACRFALVGVQRG
jgi:hypothetical protein